MFSLSSSTINDIIEALIPAWEPALNGPQINYMATKCGGCSGTCKTGCSSGCKVSCRQSCKQGCIGGCRMGCVGSCKKTCKYGARK